MRLLQYDSYGNLSFADDPPDGHDRRSYAILSHRWGPDTEEVSFRDFVNSAKKNTSGYKKLIFCANQARHDGLRYFWVDTCCINKENKAEENKAIASMFRWYSRAARCYVYLDDVSATNSKRWRLQPKVPWAEDFRCSKWFTRGWTLQELLAPSTVQFFSHEGTLLGDKIALGDLISEITGINVTALRGEKPLDSFDVEERFTWAKDRQTTREEDWAYSLLGIFGVYIAPQYDEGKGSAVRRLRDAIDADKICKHFLHDKLPTADRASFNSLTEGAAPTCHPDTRVELLDQIHQWVDQPRGEAIFWLNGMAGTGKSTISRTVSRAFAAKSQRRLAASFFFKRGDGDRGTVAKFFTTIAAQLALSVPNIAAHIKNAVDSDPAIVGKAMWDQFEKLIVTPLSQISSDVVPSSSLAIVVDALDECERDEDVRLIINLFSRVKSLSTVPLKIFLTSRPDLPIRLGFRDIAGRYQDLVLHEIPAPDIERDISTYLQFELAKVRDDFNNDVAEHRRLPPTWPGQSTIHSLVEMAVPLFIFAATICRFVSNRKGSNPDKQLRKFLQYQAIGQESKLDSMYRPVLDQLIAGLSAVEEEQVLQQFHLVVGSIVGLADPLSTGSLARLLNISRDTIDDILDLLHSVLSVPSSSNSPVRLLHLSFRDFLVDPRKRETNPFWVDERHTHQQLAVRCLQIMYDGLRTDICGLQAPGVPRSTINPQIISDHIPPELQYACLYWVYHIQQGGVQLQDGDQYHAFLKQHFLHWVEALSFVGRAAESINLMQTLRSAIQVGS
jgi:hypothetical protein